MATSPVMSTVRLKDQYNNNLRKDLKKELKLDNIHQVPKLKKIVVSNR